MEANKEIIIIGHLITSKVLSNETVESASNSSKKRKLVEELKQEVNFDCFEDFERLFLTFFQILVNKKIIIIALSKINEFVQENVLSYPITFEKPETLLRVIEKTDFNHLHKVSEDSKKIQDQFKESLGHWINDSVRYKE